jgi:hypothetical protein
VGLGIGLEAKAERHSKSWSRLLVRGAHCHLLAKRTHHYLGTSANAWISHHCAFSACTCGHVCRVSSSYLKSKTKYLFWTTLEKYILLQKSLFYGKYVYIRCTSESLRVSKENIIKNQDTMDLLYIKPLPDDKTAVSQIQETVQFSKSYICCLVEAFDDVQWPWVLPLQLCIFQLPRPWRSTSFAKRLLKIKKHICTRNFLGIYFDRIKSRIIEFTNAALIKWCKNQCVFLICFHTLHLNISAHLSLTLDTLSGVP